MTIAVSRGEVKIDGNVMKVDVDVNGAVERDVVITFLQGTRIDAAKMPKGTQFLILDHGEGFQVLPARWANSQTSSEAVALLSTALSINDRISALESAHNTHVHLGVTPGMGITGIVQTTSSTSATVAGSTTLEVT